MLHPVRWPGPAPAPPLLRLRQRGQPPGLIAHVKQQAHQRQDKGLAAEYAGAGTLYRQARRQHQPRHGVFGGEALILPLMALLLYVGYEAGRLATLAQAEQRRRRAGPPYRVEHGDK